MKQPSSCFVFFFSRRIVPALRGRDGQAGCRIGGGAASPLECLFSGEKETCYLLITAKIRGAPTETESAAINGGVAMLQDPSLSRYNAPPLLSGRNDCGRYFGRFSSFEIARGIQIVQPSGKCRKRWKITIRVFRFHDCCKADFTVLYVLPPGSCCLCRWLNCCEEKNEQIDKITSTVAQIDYIKDTL